MNYLDIKKKHGIGTSESESKETTTNSSLSYSEIAKKHGISYDVDEKYINSFISDVNSYISTDENSLFSTWNKLGLGSRANTVRGWLYHNKNNLDEKTYKSLSDTVDSLVSLDSYYSQFESEDVYNDWYESYKEKKAVLDAEDFEHYSQIGANIENPTYAQANASDNFLGWKNPFKEGEKINNVVTFSRDNAKDIEKALASSNSNADISSVLGDYRYRFMTDEEVSIYNYYLGKGDTQKAEEYLATLDDTLNRRHAGQMADTVGDNKFLEMVFALNAGMDQFASGIGNLDNLIMGTEADPTTVSQYTSSMIREDLDGVWGVAYDLTQTTGNMLPSILVGSLTGGAGGALTLGTSAVGNGYAEMRRLGYDEWQSRGYGLLVGASEATLSYFLGGISNLGGKVSGKAVSKLVAKIDNAFARTAIKLGGNMASEGLEEAIQTALEPAFKALMTGEDFEAPEWDEVLYSALLGALSAGVLEGGASIAGTAINSYKAKNTYGADAQALVTKSLDIDPENAHAQRMQERLDNGKNVSGYQLNRLVESNEQTLRTQDTSKMTSATAERLTELGEQGDVGKLAEVLVKQASGEKLSLSEKNLIKNSKYGQRVSNELSPSNIESGEYTSMWAEGIGTERINTDAYNKALYDLASEQAGVTVGEEKPSVTVNTTSKEIATESEFKASEDGKTKLGETEVSIKEIASVKDGEITLRLEDGSTVKASDVEFSSNEEGLLYENVVHMGLNAATANAFINGYDGNIPVAEYAADFRRAYRYGELGIPTSEMNTEGYSSRLSESQKSLAYNLGKTDAKYKVEKNQSDKEKIASTGTIKSEKIASKGKLHNNLKPTNETQKASLKALGVLAEALNIDIYTFESPTDAKGRRLGENGSYDPRTKTLRIDLYAGADGKGTMLFTAAHELTHHIREKLPAKFKAFADFLFEQYGEKGISVSKLIAKKKADLEKWGRITPDMTEAQAYDLAYEEVVADACESFLADGEAVAKIAELKAKDKTLWQTIKDFITNLVERIKVAYEGLTPDSREGRLVAEMLDSAEKLKAMWTEMLVEASEVSDLVEVDMDTESVAPLFSERTWTESEYVTHRDQMAEKIANALGVSIKKAKSYIDDINSIAKMIANDRVRLDYEASSFGSAFVSNVEYGGSFDYTTLCKKRRIFTGTFTEIQKRLKDVALTPDDILTIRNLMINEGIEATCGLCYVEGSRANMGKFAKEFIRLYKRDNPLAWIPNMADVNTPDGVEQMRISHPEAYDQYVYFWNHYGKLKDSDPALFASQQKPKLYEARKEYKGEILEHFEDVSTVAKKNRNGGIRMQSFSDFEIVHLIDTMQVIMDMSTVGLAGQAYTKVPEFAKAFGNTGLKINLSLIAKGVDADGNLIFDDREGMPHKTAFELRDRYSKNVGTIIVTFTDEQLLAAMADPRIDFIIPFHRSQWKKGQYGAMGLPKGTKDYTYMQNEKLIKKTYHEYRGRMVLDKASNYMPNEYWDFSKSGKENAEAYLKMCAENNKRPKFYKLLDYDGKGTYSLKTDGSTDGYWKLLVDFKMYDNEGVGSPQNAVTPTFNMDESKAMLDEYQGGHSKYPMASSVVDNFVEKYNKEHGTKYSDRNPADEKLFNPEGKSLDEQLDDILKTSEAFDGRYLYIGRFTPDFIDMVKSYVDINDLPIAMNYRDAYLSMESKDHGKYKGNGVNYHNLGKQGLKSAIESFGSPEQVLLSKKDGKIEMVIEGVDKKGNKLLSIVALNTHARNAKKYIEAHIVTSIYGKSSIDRYVSKAEQEGRLIYNKNEELTQVNSQVQYEGIINANSSKSSISQDSESVKSKFSDRNPDSVSNRSLLANALESVAQNDIERNKLNEYKSKIALIESEQAKLAELRGKIKELSFAKGKRDVDTIKSLQFEANQTANRINTYDRQLLNLESTKALKGVLEREKQMAYKKAEQKGKEALTRQKEKDAKTQRELLTRYQESRKKGIESRHKTEMRHKIKDVVNELNQYLLKGTKDKHVPIELQKAVAEALDAVNMDTVGAEERIAKKREEMMRAKTPEAIEKLAKEIERIQEMGGNMANKISRLKTAYDSIINSDDPLIANSHDEVIANTIDKVVEVVGETPLRDMSLYQLEAVHDMYRMILHSIRTANKAFKAEKGLEISVLANTVIADLDGKTRNRLNVADTKFAWNNLKPVYAFERIGSNTFTKLFNAVREGEDVWARDMSEAQTFREEQSKKYKFDSWDFEKKYTFETQSRKSFELDLGEMMSIYAFAKDEHSKGHLIGEGFVFDPKKEVVENVKGKIKIKVNFEDATAYNLSDQIVADIIDKLTPDQKAFADAMQDYLSTTMGEKGNEVSLELYEIKLFKNKNYFPLKVAPQYMAIAKEKAQGDVKIKNKGFTKDRKEGAKNPIVLSSFMDVWATHVNEMSMYHAFTLPLEDFYRVFNYKTPRMEGYAPMSVNASIQNAYGEAATSYIEQLLKDLNGGTRSDPRETWGKAMMSNFKKASVMASLSVVIQQPSAIVRATALVDAKYFVGKKATKGKHKEVWAEVKKYAPVAVIKEMGYFDTGMGKSSVEWLKGEKTFMDRVDDTTSKAPALADELAWCTIWNAVKRETLHTHKNLIPNSEEFLKAVGERFTEVIVKTQVYDSTLARSANMRSKGALMNMWTAFMAEPTTSINILQDAFSKGKRGKYTAKALGAVYGSVILNAALVSIVYAMRDDDDDETYLEKYLSRLTTEVIDGVNPITYIPFFKDIWSVLQGFDVERADMSLITKLSDSLQQLVKVISKDTSDMDEDELAEHKKAVAESILSISDSLASLVGVPVKNVRRDIMGIINGFNTIKGDINGRETTAGSLGDNVLEDVKDSVPVWGWFPDESKSDKLYDAIIKGDSAYIDRLKSGYKDDKAYASAIRKALRENDPRIKQAAEARYNGDIAEYMRIAKEIIAEGHFKQDDIVAAINSEISALKKGEETTESTSSDKATSIYKMDDYYAALVGRDQATAYAVKEDLIKTDVANGKDRDEAEADFNSRFASHLREQYEAGELSEYEAEDMLINYGGKTEESAFSKVQYWEFKKEYPDYDLSEEAVTKYYNEVEPSGIDVGVYYDYYKQRSKCKGTDSDGDGKTDSGSVKSEVLYVIDSLPITNSQKDVLYYLNGWSAKTIYEAPWH